MAGGIPLCRKHLSYSYYTAYRRNRCRNAFYKLTKMEGTAKFSESIDNGTKPIQSKDITAAAGGLIFLELQLKTSPRVFSRSQAALCSYPLPAVTAAIAFKPIVLSSHNGFAER